MVQKTQQDQEFESLPLRLAWGFLKDHGLGADADLIRKSPEQFGSYTTTLRRAKIVALLRKKKLLDEFIKTNWRYALESEGEKKLKWYEHVYSKYQASGTALVHPDVVTTEEDDEAASTKFALEEQLRDYLARNLGILENGLSLWPVKDGDAVEFLVDEQGPSHRIDILAKDKAGVPVVIELKVSRGHEKTVGQALYYRSRVKHIFGVDQARIFIVAAEISPELRAAASEVPGIFLFEYSLEVTVKALAN